MIDAAAFFAAYTEAWNDGDVEALSSFFAVPLLIGTGDATQFIETRDALFAHLSALLAGYDDHGAVIATLGGVEVEPLDGDAAQVVVAWRFAAEDGRDLLAYRSRATLARDEDEPDAVPRIVALDVRDEIAAQRAAGWDV